MLNNKFANTLKIVAQRLNQAKINWTLIASINLALQGLNIEPKDIDILVSFTDKEEIKKVFQDFKIIEAGQCANTKHEKIKLSIEKVEVEFCCERQNGFYRQFLSGGGTVNVRLDSLAIPCLKLENEIIAYQYLGRPDKVKLIKEFISKNGSR